MNICKYIFTYIYIISIIIIIIIILLYYIILYYIILCYIILCYIILYYITLHYIILYYIIYIYMCNMYIHTYTFCVFYIHVLHTVMNHTMAIHVIGSITLTATVDSIATYILSDFAMTRVCITCWQMTRFQKPEINNLFLYNCPLSCTLGPFIPNLEVSTAKRGVIKVELDGPNYENNTVGRR